MKYVVTGGLGFVGNELVRQLKPRGHVTILDNRNRVAPDIADIGDVPVHDLDITDAGAVQRAMADIKPDVVFHLAAIHFIPECNDNPERTLRVNVEGTLSVLRAAAAAGARKVVAASSGAVYADSSEALREDSPAEPVDIYGHSKVIGEQIGRWYQQESGLRLVMVRLFNVYGPRETNLHILPEVITQLRRSDVLQLGSTTPRRDFIFTKDAAEGFIRLADAETPAYMHVNLASGHHASVDELIQRMSRMLHRSTRIETDPRRFRKADKLIQVADIELLRRLTGWSPRYDLDSGLDELLRYEGLL